VAGARYGYDRRLAARGLQPRPSYPTEIHPPGGLYKGKAAMDRIRAVAAEFDFLKFDTSSLIA
jgi:hypothetical protein